MFRIFYIVSQFPDYFAFFKNPSVSQNPVSLYLVPVRLFWELYLGKPFLLSSLIFFYRIRDSLLKIRLFFLFVYQKRISEDWMVYLSSRNLTGFKLRSLFCHSNFVSNPAFQTGKVIMKSVFFQHVHFQHLIFQSSRKDNDLLFVEWRERKIKADPSYLLFLCILH